MDNSLLTIQVKKEDWIPCSERLPRPDDWTYVRLWDSIRQRYKATVMRYSRKAGKWIGYGFVQGWLPVHGMMGGLIVSAWSPMPQWWEGHGLYGGNHQGLPERLDRLTAWLEAHGGKEGLELVKHEGNVRLYHSDENLPYIEMGDWWHIWVGDKHIYGIYQEPERAMKRFRQACRDGM